jgi:hypothetical protein
LLGATCIGIEIKSSSNQIPYEGSITANTIQRVVSGIICKGFGTTAGQVLGDISIVGNSLVNCAQAVTIAGGGEPADSFDSLGAKGVGIENCRGVSISDNKFVDLGVWRDSGGTQALPAGDTQVYGIFCRSSSDLLVSSNQIGRMYANHVSPQTKVFTRPIRVDAQSSGVGAGVTLAVSNVSIMGNTIQGTGTTPSFGQALYDNGIALVAQEGNDVGAVYSISEGHISNNTVLDLSLVATLAALVPPVECSGIKIEKVDQGRIADINIANNVIRGVQGFGINAYAKSAGAPLESDLQSLSITGNNIDGLGPAHVEISAAIRVFGDEGSDIQGTNITNNSIGAVVANGIYVACHAGTAPKQPARVRRTSIQGNSIDTVSGNSSTGIRVTQDGDLASILHTSVSSNTIGIQISAASASVLYGISYAAGDVVATGAGPTDIIALSIRDNTLVVGRDVDPVGIGAHGIRVASLALAGGGPQCLGLELCGNSTTTYSTVANYGVSVDLHGYELDTLEMDGNSYVSINGTPGMQVGCYLRAQFTGDVEAFRHEQVSINSNVCRTAGTQPAIQARFEGNASILGASVCGNSVYSLQGSGIFCDFNGGGASNTNFVDSFRICNNSVVNGGIDFNLSGIVNSSFEATAIVVDDNVINGQGGAGRGIDLNFDGADQYLGENVSVSGNSITQHQNGLRVWANPLGAKLTNLKMDGNSVSNFGNSAGASQALSLISFTPLSGASISGNSIQGGGVGAGLDSVGILYKNEGEKPTEGLSVCSNNIHKIGGQAIKVALGARKQGVVYYNDVNISIDDNNITRTNLWANTDNVLEMGPDATNTDPGRIKGFSISRNSIAFCGKASTTPVAAYILANAEWYKSASNGRVDGNSCEAGDYVTDAGVSQTHNPANAIRIHTPDVPAGTDSGLINFSCSGNALHMATYRSIYMIQRGPLKGIDLSRNTCAGNPSIAHIEWQNYDRSSDGVSITDNVLSCFISSLTRRGGIWFHSSSMTNSREFNNVRICGNQLMDIASGVAGTAEPLLTTDYGGIVLDLKDHHIRNMAVDGNSIHSPGNHGIYIADGNTDYPLNQFGISVSDNLIRHTEYDSGTVAYTGILVSLGNDGVSASDVINCSFSSNVVQFSGGAVQADMATGLWFIAFDGVAVGLTPELRMIQFNDNQLRGHRGSGLRIDAAGDPTGGDPIPAVAAQQITVSNNMVRSKIDAYGTGYDFSLNFAGVGVGVGYCSVFTGNSAYGYDIPNRVGFYFKTPAFAPRSWMVANNTARNYAANMSCSLNPGVAFTAGSGVCANNLTEGQDGTVSDTSWSNATSEWGNMVGYNNNYDA